VDGRVKPGHDGKGNHPMTNVVQLREAERACVVALHCSLGSGRQWTKLAAALGPGMPLIAPDLAGYGGTPGSFDLPMSLAQEVEGLRAALAEAKGPIHLVSHSYGGAIAFKIATASVFSSRIRSLTLIAPVLPTLLKDSDADRRLHDRFVWLSHELYQDLWNGLTLEAIDKFTEFWRGSGPREPLAPAARIRMIERAERLAFDFTAALAEENPIGAAASLRLPVLLLSGGLSPYLTQRVAQRLAAVIDGAELRHLPDAGHMLPLTHADAVNAEIVRHIARADELARIPLMAGQPMAEAIRLG
jgi:pimeloyl-ACP methyl ester carboxylesterase